MINNLIKIAAFSIHLAVANAQTHNLDSLYNSQIEQKQNLSQYLNENRIDHLFSSSKKMKEVANACNNATVKGKTQYVFDWITHNVEYVHGDSINSVNDWESTALTVADKTGTCLHLAALAHQLLEELEAPSVIISKFDSKTNKRIATHVFNATYVDDGMYVFDCTPFSKPPRFYSMEEFKKIVLSNDVEIASFREVTALMHYGRLRVLDKQSKAVGDGSESILTELVNQANKAKKLNPIINFGGVSNLSYKLKQ